MIIVFEKMLNREHIQTSSKKTVQQFFMKNDVQKFPAVWMEKTQIFPVKS